MNLWVGVCSSETLLRVSQSDSGSFGNLRLTSHHMAYCASQFQTINIRKVVEENPKDQTKKWVDDQKNVEKKIEEFQEERGKENET